VSAERVALTPQCTECGRVWMPNDEERWSAYWVGDGPEEALAFFCPDCAEREFKS
jgi:hypothetical protein